MNGLVISVHDHIPPPESDIVLKINFKEGVGSAARPFEIAAELIRALEGIDDALVRTVDSKIETALIVEDLQKSSIKVFLKNVLEHMDDDSLKTLDWKPMIGQFLVRGKYAAIRWLDSGSRSYADLTEEISTLTKEASEINHLPTPALPNPARMNQAMDKWQVAKGRFVDGEGLTVTLEKTEYQVDVSSTWSPSERLEDTDAERELVSENELILMVRKPDMLGSTAWQFRLGKQNLSMTIHDQDWLTEYQSGEIALSPGDAMQVLVRTESKYSASGEVLETSQTITKVVKVISRNSQSQAEMEI